MEHNKNIWRDEEFVDVPVEGVEIDFTTRAAPDSIRGRGARSNAVGRYEKEQRLTVDDGWGGPAEWQGTGRARRTQVSIDTSRSIIARNSSPDLGFDQSINPYRGCEHGCIYCFARPTHAWLGLSPGLDFETQLFMKPDAAALLDSELRKPGYACKTIALGTNTDPYQPLEREHGITRSVLKVLQRFNHPVGIVTKSDLVTRDIDILSDMASRGLVKVALSVTTLDPGLARRMEPRAATPAKRLQAVAQLASAGIPVGVLAAPMIPSLNEPEMEDILAASRTAGATEAGYIMVRLPLEITDLFQEWLAEEAPNRASRIMKLIREMRGGRDYDARFGKRMTGTGAYAAMVAKRFRIATARLGLNERRLRLDATQFQPPPRAGDQLSLL
ncbi:MAG: PA0069 family radical SAM protein [Minwuia sp.]|nr:PA0069 family radical SAM protein [Minwuia sp.]